LPVLAEVAPVPVAVLLFSEGAASIHHAFRIDSLTRDLEASSDARDVLRDMHAEIDQLDPGRAAALVRLLAEEYAV
jgi:hypothetical protein